jgi:hypothetical protein
MTTCTPRVYRVLITVKKMLYKAYLFYQTRILYTIRGTVSKFREMCLYKVNSSSIELCL